MLSLILGSVLAARWELFLRFTNSVPFSQNDPVYGLDLGFFIFNLPFYSFLQGWVLGLFIVVLLATIALHFINYSMRGVGYELNGPRLIHISIIAAVIMLAMAVGPLAGPVGAGAVWRRLHLWSVLHGPEREKARDADHDDRGVGGGGVDAGQHLCAGNSGSWSGPWRYG